MRIAGLVVAIGCTLSLQGQAQNHSPARAAAPNVQSTALAKFIGRWEGEAQVSMPGATEPRHIHMVEVAQWKLSGTAVLVEGRGTMKNPDTGEDTVVHDAVGIMRLDPKSNSLRMHAFKFNEPLVDSALALLDNGDLRWSMEPAPGRLVRFTITITDDTWREVGEFSPDAGQTWRGFLEMNLKRVAMPND